MRNTALFFLALLAALSTSSVVLVNTFDSTFLNKNYIAGKIEENGLYETLFDSMPASDANFLGIKGFVEVIQAEPAAIKAEKSVVNGLVSSFVSYLKDPLVQTIEFGLPSGLFAPGTTVSGEDLLPRKALLALAQAKRLVQIGFALRSICLLLGLGFIALLLIIARGVKAKLQWLGFSLLSLGVFLFLFSAIARALMSREIEAVLAGQDKLSTTLYVLFQSMLSGFTFLGNFQGILFVVLGAFFFFVPFFLVHLSKQKKKQKNRKRKV